MATYVMGDIHGRLVTFISMLDKIKLDKEKDILYLLGDYTDSGPDGVGVIQHIIETNPTNSQSNHQNSEEINPTVGNYIGNINSKKFHLPSCHTLPAEKNQIYFDTREEALNSGYSPCGNCNP